MEYGTVVHDALDGVCRDGQRLIRVDDVSSDVVQGGEVP